MTSRKGVRRVVWKRQRKFSGTFDSIPFLSVSRSLGDFWSYNPRTNHFTVSPKPDVAVHPLDPRTQRFIVIASDGLWDVMSPDEVVKFIWDYENDKDECHQPRDVVRAIINEALRKWEQKKVPADNIAVLIAFLTEASVEVESGGPAAKEEDASDAQEVSPGSAAGISIEVRDTPPALPSLVVPAYVAPVEPEPEVVKVMNTSLPLSSFSKSPIGKHPRIEDSRIEDSRPSLKRCKHSAETALCDQ